MRLLLIITFIFSLLESNGQMDSLAMTPEAESIFLHIDQKDKLSGDVLWFKLYLVNVPYRPAALSAIAYVELLDSKNEILTRLKLKCSNGISNGQILLPQELKTGVYTVRAFTLWMQNHNMAGSNTSRINIYNSNEFDTGSSAPEVEMIPMQNSKPNSLSLNSNKEIYKPNEPVIVRLEPIDKKKPANWASVSISVHSKTTSINSGFKFQTDVQGYESNFKEMFIYPIHSSSLPAIEFDTQQIDEQIKNLGNNQSNDSNELFVQHLIKENFPSNNDLGEFKVHRPPFDITYRANDYLAIETLEEFFREIVPHARILKSDNVRTIRIRNSENDQNMFFYKKQPLILVNGHVINNTELLLSLQWEDIVSISLSWKASTINHSQIYGLVDNGILCIETSRSTNFENNYSKLYDQLHQPADFKEQIASSKEEDSIPDFRDLLYWSPEKIISGKSVEFSFHTSDKLGEYIIEVVGLTQTGDFINISKTFTVAAPLKD